MFDAEYYRGTVAAVGRDGLLQVNFDDGDVRHAVPPNEAHAPLIEGVRVECCFSGSDEVYYPGTISLDRGDGTYTIAFDDGDVLEAAARRLIRLIGQPDNITNNNAPPSVEDPQLQINSPVRFSNQFQSSPVRVSGQFQPQSFGTDPDVIASAHEISAVMLPIAPILSAQESVKEPERLEVDNVVTEDNLGYEDENFEQIVTQQTVTGMHKARLAFGRLRKAMEGGSGDDGGTEHDSDTHDRRGSDTVSQEVPEAPARLPTEYRPGVPNPRWRHIDDMADTLDVLGQAPPDLRLSALLYRVCMLEQQLEEQENTGEAYDTSSGPIPPPQPPPMPPDRHPIPSPHLDAADVRQSPRNVHGDAIGTNQSGAGVGIRSGGGIIPSFPRGREMRGVEDALLKLRMREVALVRLCYSEVSPEMAEALCGLATCYAEHGQWAQVSAHMLRGSQIITALRGRPDSLHACGGSSVLQYPTSERYLDSITCAMSPALAGTILVEFFRILREVCIEKSVEKSAFVSALKESSVGGLRELGESLTKGLPERFTWGQAVAYLRQHSAQFSDLNEKILEGGASREALAQARAAFASVDASGDDVVRASDVSIAIHTACMSMRSRRLGAAHANLPAQLRKVVEAGFTGRNADCPVAWEEIVAMMCTDVAAGTPGGARAAQDWLCALKVRIMLLAGRSQTATGRYPAAIENLSAALDELRRENNINNNNSNVGINGNNPNEGIPTVKGVDPLAAAPVHSAMGDLLAARHSQRATDVQKKARKMAEQWLSSDAGREVWRREARRLAEEYVMGLPPGGALGATGGLTRVELEHRAKEALLRHRARLYAKELDAANNVGIESGQGGDLGLATDHLTRSWELLTSKLGSSHPACAAACVSLGNLCIVRCNTQEAVNWFRRALVSYKSCFGGKITPSMATASVALGRLLLRGEKENCAAGDPLNTERSGEPGYTSHRSSSNILTPGRPLEAAQEEAAQLFESAAAVYLERVQLASNMRSSANGEVEPDLATEGAVLGALERAGSYGQQARTLYSEAARLWEGLGDKTKAATAMSHVVEAVEAMQGPHSLALAKLCHRLGEAWEAAGDNMSACSSYGRAHVAFSASCGRGDPRTKRSAADCDRCRRAAGSVSSSRATSANSTIIGRTGAIITTSRLGTPNNTGTIPRTGSAGARGLWSAGSARSMSAGAPGDAWLGSAELQQTNTGVPDMLLEVYKNM